MVKKETKFLGWNGLVLLFVALLPLAACTKKQILDNKVGTNQYISKKTFGTVDASQTHEAAFKGREYYLVRGIEEADIRNAVRAFPGYQENYGKVRVKITESNLLFEVIAAPGFGGFLPNYATDAVKGKVIASFPITKHFDIIRDYNQYGELTNTTVEDERREWWQREYIRVDWSQPSAGSFKTTSQIDLFGNLTEESVSLLEDAKVAPDGHVSFKTEVTMTDLHRLERRDRVLFLG